MIADQTKWNERHAGRTGHHPADTYLLKMQHHLKPGRLLDIASGRGRNGLHLAKSGYDVLAVDISNIGLEAIQDAAKLNNLNIKTLLLDLDHPQALMSDGPFDNVIIINFKPLKNLLDLMPDLLVAGGKLLWCSFNELQIDVSGFNPDKALYPAEFVSHFKKLNLIDYCRFEDASGHRDGYLFERNSV